MCYRSSTTYRFVLPIYTPKCPLKHPYGIWFLTCSLLPPSIAKWLAHALWFQIPGRIDSRSLVKLKLNYDGGWVYQRTPNTLDIRRIAHRNRKKIHCFSLDIQLCDYPRRRWWQRTTVTAFTRIINFLFYASDRRVLFFFFAQGPAGFRVLRREGPVKNSLRMRNIVVWTAW